MSEKIDVYSLDAFTTQFLETLLWSEGEIDDSSGETTGEKYDDKFGIADFCQGILKEIVSDCEEFQREYSELWEADDKSDSNAGHNFCLTRNGHGAGFWDGDYPTHGDALTEQSKTYGTIGLYVGDDGKLYTHS